MVLSCCTGILDHSAPYVFVCLFNSILSRGDYCYQLITFANSLDTDQD